MSTTGAELLDLAVATTRAAAEFVRARRPSGRVPVAATKSSDTDPVTEIDRECERLIRGLIAAARPDDGFLGEEDGLVAGSSDVTWVVDPIDGTVNFVYDIPYYAVSVAAEVAGKVVVGCVINIVSGEEFRAVHGGGAYHREPSGDEQRLRCPDESPLEHSLVATGFSYDDVIRRTQGSAVSELVRSVADIRRFGAASLDLCGVAQGRTDAYVEQGLKPWDIAAGALIAREAGAVVTGLDGEATERLTVASGPTIADELLELVRRNGF